MEFYGLEFTIVNLNKKNQLKTSEFVFKEVLRKAF